VVLGAMMFAYQSMSYWYASLLRQAGRAPLAYLVALNVGGIIGAAAWGALGDTRLGRRGAITAASFTTVMVLPLFLYAETPSTLWLGALLTGLTGAGIIGVVPAYLGSQFPTAVRSYRLRRCLPRRCRHRRGRAVRVGCFARCDMVAARSYGRVHRCRERGHDSCALEWPLRLEYGGGRPKGDAFLER